MQFDDRGREAAFRPEDWFEISHPRLPSLSEIGGQIPQVLFPIFTQALHLQKEASLGALQQESLAHFSKLLDELRTNLIPTRHILRDAAAAKTVNEIYIDLCKITVSSTIPEIFNIVLDATLKHERQGLRFKSHLLRQALNRWSVERPEPGMVADTISKLLDHNPTSAYLMFEHGYSEEIYAQAAGRLKDWLSRKTDREQEVERFIHLKPVDSEYLPTLSIISRELSKLDRGIPQLLLEAGKKTHNRSTVEQVLFGIGQARDTDLLSDSIKSLFEWEEFDAEYVATNFVKLRISGWKAVSDQFAQRGDNEFIKALRKLRFINIESQNVFDYLISAQLASLEGVRRGKLKAKFSSIEGNDPQTLALDMLSDLWDLATSLEEQPGSSTMKRLYDEVDDVIAQLQVSLYAQHALKELGEN